MRAFLFLVVACFAASCSARVVNVRLAPPQIALTDEVLVRDRRADPQVYMTAIGIGSTPVLIHLLAPNPPLEISLRRFIQSRTPRFAAMLVSIERLDLKNRVGFAKADELSCELESSVTTPSRPDGILVRTFSKNGLNMSPLVSTAARVILQQCLEQHAKEVVERLSVSEEARTRPEPSLAHPNVSER